MRQSGKAMFAVPHPDLVSPIQTSFRKDFYDIVSDLFTEFVLYATSRDKAPFVQLLQDDVVKADWMSELRRLFVEWTDINVHWILKEDSLPKVVWMFQAFEEAGYEILEYMNHQIRYGTAFKKEYRQRLRTIRNIVFNTR